MRKSQNGTTPCAHASDRGEFWTRHPDAEQPLKAWYDEAKHAIWATPQDIRDHYASASFVGGNRVVFNIKGNDEGSRTLTPPPA